MWAGRAGGLGAAPHYLIYGHYSVTAKSDMEKCTLKQTYSDIGHNGIVYTYADGSFEMICRSDGWFTSPGWEVENRELPEKRKRKKGVKSSGEDMKRSMQRARAKVRRLALSNEFSYFVTLTLDPAKVDRYNPEEVTRILSNWTDNMVRRRGLKYIIVPELHKDGAFHFHGFFNSCVKTVDSGHKDPRGCTIWNLPDWTWGFSTAMELYGEYGAAVAYVCKYIGKQSGQRPLGRWYYSGGGLNQPHKDYVDLDYRELQEAGGIEFNIPGSKMIIVKGREE